MAHVEVKHNGSYAHTVGPFDNEADAYTWVDSAQGVLDYASVTSRDVSYPSYKADKSPQQIAAEIINQQEREKITARISKVNNKLIAAVQNLADTNNKEEMQAWASVIKKAYLEVGTLAKDHKAVGGSSYESRIDLYTDLY